MGFGDLSVMGNQKVQTPNLDRLAREGVLMTQFYVAAPICSASRAGLLTGRFPAEVGFINYVSDRAYTRSIGQAAWLDPGLPHIARMLKGAIGRASCRARACQYGSPPVRAVQLKKQTQKVNT